MHVPVLIAGGGPSGLVLAAELSRHGVASVLAERNEHTTLFPKMDITNGASMELLRRLGVEAELRAVGVAPQHSFGVIFAGGLNGLVHGRWRLPSVDEQRATIAATADGSVRAACSRLTSTPERETATDEYLAVDIADPACRHLRWRWRRETQPISRKTRHYTRRLGKRRSRSTDQGSRPGRGARRG
jgi:hypothetical protein